MAKKTDLTADELRFFIKKDNQGQFLLSTPEADNLPLTFHQTIIDKKTQQPINYFYVVKKIQQKIFSAFVVIITRGNSFEVADFKQF